jgi:hypothetical protein
MQQRKYEQFTSDFFDFCEEEHENAMQSAVSAPPAQQLNIYAKGMNVKLLYKKWCNHYSPSFSNVLVPLRISDVTFGLATTYMSDVRGAHY